MNSYRNTSLHYAVQGRDVTVIQALLSAKADVQATNEYVLSVQLQAAPVDFRLPMRSPLFLQHLIFAHFILQKWGHAAACRRQAPCHQHPRGCQSRCSSKEPVRLLVCAAVFTAHMPNTSSFYRSV